MHSHCFDSLPNDVVTLILSFGAIRTAGAIAHRSEPDTFETRESNYSGAWRTAVAFPDKRSYSIILSYTPRSVILKPVRFEPKPKFIAMVLRILGNLCHGFADHTLAFNPGFPHFSMASVQLGSHRDPYDSLRITWDGNHCERSISIHRVFIDDNCAMGRPMVRKFVREFCEALEENTYHFHTFPHVDAVVNNNPDSSLTLGSLCVGQPLIAASKTTMKGMVSLKEQYYFLSPNASENSNDDE
jgi:hypothetical protein